MSKAKAQLSQAIRNSGGAYHLKDLTTDKLKMLASKDSKGATYDWNELINRIS
jgi:hypothetical protein